MGKIFKSKEIPELFYKVIYEGWMGNDTYLVAFSTMKDSDDDYYHLEVEYHKDEEKIVYTRVYDYENISQNETSPIISESFKKQIDEYILKQVGVVRDGSVVLKQKVSLELTLDMPQGTTIGELRHYLSNLKFNFARTNDEKIKILSVNKEEIKV